jgi:hypothetical protein
MIGGQGGARPLWPSLSEVIGTPATFDKANKPEERWLGAFLGSGTRMAAELQAEIARARVLRDGAPSAAGATAPPKSNLFDVPNAGFGYRASKAQRQVLEEVRVARLTALENRASNPHPDDQRRRAFEKGHNDKDSNSLPGGVPLPPTRFSNTQEFQVAVQSMFGVGFTCLIPFTDHTPSS